MNQFTSASDPKELERKHDLIRYMGKYGGIIAFIVSSGIIAALYLIILINLISSGSKLSSLSAVSGESYITMLLQRELTILTVIVAICTIARIIPFAASIMIFVTSKKEGPIERILTGVNLIKIFGIIETAAWILMAVFYIYSIIKSGGIKLNNSSQLFSFVLSVLILIFKPLQGYSVFKYMNTIKNAIKHGDLPNESFGTFKFASVMLATIHIIFLITIVSAVFRAGGLQYGFELFKQSFSSLWFIYLYLAAYAFSNLVASNISTVHATRIRLANTSGFKPTIPNYYENAEKPQTPTYSTAPTYESPNSRFEPNNQFNAQQNQFNPNNQFNVQQNQFNPNNQFNAQQNQFNPNNQFNAQQNQFNPNNQFNAQQNQFNPNNQFNVQQSQFNQGYTAPAPQQPEPPKPRTNKYHDFGGFSFNDDFNDK